MIRQLRVSLTEHDGELAEALGEWLRGEESPEAEAAGLVVAETILMWRTILKSKLK